MGISINAQNDATSEYVRSVHEICKIVMVDGRPLSHEEIRQEVATFLFAVNVEQPLYCIL
jgi:hypothetical protein